MINEQLRAAPWAGNYRYALPWKKLAASLFKRLIINLPCWSGLVNFFIGLVHSFLYVAIFQITFKSSQKMHHEFP